ncbi:hypothetical protein [Pedobacter gandavensis]|uniref:hypothetical protein n=1 Tax=Pedobacter gandavensis TaxID=2679963 RepID=UPI00292DB9CE|nr:hypothetical protein [Pedobacter gandavensis]
MYILFNFINRSNSSDASVVMFQKNVSASADGTAIAYKVIKNARPEEKLPFSFPVNMEIGAKDTDGYESPNAPAEGGDTFMLQRAAGSDSLYKSVSKGNPNEILLYNLLNTGRVDAFLYKEYKVLARQIGITHIHSAVFEIKPSLWIGVTDQVAEGGVMSAGLLSNIKTELPLTGLKSADIVMTGDVGRFEFALENAVIG